MLLFIVTGDTDVMIDDKPLRRRSLRLTDTSTCTPSSILSPLCPVPLLSIPNDVV